MFLIIGEFRHERNYFQISSNTELEAYISFLSSCLPDFFLYMYTRDDFLVDSFQMDICHFTYNPSEEPLVMLLWLFSRFLSSHHAENREEYQDTNNFLPKFFFISHEDSKRLPKLSSLPSMLLCSLKEKSISSAFNW